ncbi:MAG: hypothetical protein WCT77_13600 [Bacteroidota bacterium]
MKVDTDKGYLRKPKEKEGYSIESYYCECGCKKSYYHYVKINQIGMKKENWSKGKNGHTVITDTPDGLPENSGYTGTHADQYYGGALICESIWRKKDVALISASPDMLEALQNLENDDNSIPEHAWKLVKDAIAKATDVS